jgi:hypothetical protein
MNNAFIQFESNIRAIKEVKNTVDYLIKITTAAIDLSDLYRSQIVLAVSALDHFVHEHVLSEMIEIYRGNKSPTNHFLQFKIPISNIYNTSLTASEATIRSSIRERHSWLSFQYPDKISDAIRLISTASVWEEIGRRINMNTKDVKNQLKIIIDRRNKIAHEADMDPTNPGAKWPISSSDVDDSINFISRVVKELFDLTK